MREQLTTWIKDHHQGQLIRLTDDPYFNHLIFVAEKSGAVIPLGYEIGLCHDLIEETTVTASDLRDALLSFDYPHTQAEHICACVVELTDVFTKVAYPDFTKKKRKKKEAARLAQISPDAQTVKYADLMDNIHWTVQYDQKHAVKYLKRKQTLLVTMTMGDAGLRAEVLGLIGESKASI
jgi:hypothetical protein